jgi:hypothetical protein
MKITRIIGVMAALCIAVIGLPVCAQISIPSDGSDGALVISNNTVIDLGQAVTGVWSNNNSGNAGKGIYDPAKWAVVFKYSSVTISNGVSLSFKNHPTHAPVVWLVSGNVIINGDLSLDGAISTYGSVLQDSGPGGFRGGAGPIQGAGLADGPGFGPGGGINSGPGRYSSVYGNQQISPLIGGSGGGGSAGASGATSGGAGGGAIFAAATGVITINGSCHANGGGGDNNNSRAAGSGGAIRLLADQVLGNGSIVANGGGSSLGNGDPGRIRLEANFIGTGLAISPTASGSIPVPIPIVIWPATNASTVRLVSVAGQSAPIDPHASLASDVDIVITTNLATLTFETANFPITGTLNVFVKPRNGSQGTYQAAYLSGDSTLATWQLKTNLPLNSFIIQARAVSP